MELGCKTSSHNSVKSLFGSRSIRQSLDRGPLSANHAAANCFDALYLRFPEIHNQAVAEVVNPKSLAFPSKLLPKCWIMCPGDL